jgi:hypothetical protein
MYIPNRNLKHVLLSLGSNLQAMHERNACVNCNGPMVAACQRDQLNVSVVSA